MLKGLVARFAMPERPAAILASRGTRPATNRRGALVMAKIEEALLAATGTFVALFVIARQFCGILGVSF